jgi:hypothetical protein
MSKFTPGPWKIQSFRNGWRQPVGPNDFFTSAYVSGADESEIQANARLIAAAPELYIICKAIVDSSTFDKVFVHTLLSIVKKAVMKVEGNESL